MKTLWEQTKDGAELNLGNGIVCSIFRPPNFAQATRYPPVPLSSFFNICGTGLEEQWHRRFETAEDAKRFVERHLRELLSIAIGRLEEKE